MEVGGETKLKQAQLFESVLDIKMCSAGTN